MWNAFLNLGYTIDNTICNLVYLLIHAWKIPAGLRRLRWARQKKSSIAGLKEFINDEFIYTPEKIDYRSWVLCFAMRHWRGDCDDIASLSKWLMKRGGYETAYFSLFSKGWGHAVCLFWIEGDRYWVADTGGVKPFTSWSMYPKAERKIRRWY